MSSVLVPLLLLTACRNNPGDDSALTGILDSATAVIDEDQDGWAADLDCDDADPEVNPDASETCNGLDDDCDSLIDDDDPGRTTARKTMRASQWGHANPSTSKVRASRSAQWSR